MDTASPHYGQSDGPGEPQDGGEDTNQASYATVGERRPEPTELPSLAEAYPRAHRSARAVLETIGIPESAFEARALVDGERAERIVSLILGAALLELERPWREALERADAEAGRYWRDRNRLRQERDSAIFERDAARNHAAELFGKAAGLSVTADRRGLIIDNAHQALRDLPERFELLTGPAKDKVAEAVTVVLEAFAEELDR